MNKVKVNGIEIGAGIPKICVSIVEISQKDILEYAKRIKKSKPDLVEWRADFFDEIESITEIEDTLLKLKNILEGIPIIFTIRSFDEGGNSKINSDKYFEILNYVSVKRIVDIVDIENSKIDEYKVDTIKNIKSNGVKVIISYHNFNGTDKVDVLMEKSLQFKKIGADIVKLAVMSRSYEDLFEVLKFSDKFLKKEDTPFVAISMGKFGMISRFVGEIFGSSITFCSLEKESAPGQMNMYDTLKMMELLHKNIN